MNKLIFIVLLGILFLPEAIAKTKPTAYIIGDSTVKNGRGDGAGELWGWGDPIVQFFDTTKINIVNCALGGTSSRTFQSKGLWDEVLQKVKKGDFVLMQFGHNDNGPLNDTLRARGTIKGVGEETEEIDNLITKQHEIVHSYGWYLRKVVTDTKRKGATPLIVTPIPRNDWENGKIKRTPESYPKWAIDVAIQEKVPFIDLNKLMSDQLDTYGAEKVTGRFFFITDHTHTSAEGAVMAASLIAEQLKTIKTKPGKFLLAHPKVNFPVKRRVFIIGDSTVANGNDTIVGWGKLLPQFMDTSRIIILNKARGGRSSRTFVNEGLWNEVFTQLKKGDFVLIQFGHNDGAKPDAEKFRGSLKGTGEETLEVTKPDDTKETVHTYGWYIKKYIIDTKSKGAIPIVFSQIPRNEWPDGKVERVSTSFGGWSKEVANQTNTFFIDLNETVALKYEKMGRDKVKLFFPGDHTHTNRSGAELNAKTIAEEIRKLSNCDLKGYINLK